MSKFLLFIIIFNTNIFAYKLKLNAQEKQNIKAAVHSGTRLYGVKKNSLIYDLITNKSWTTSRPIIGKFFNTPSLSGHRFMATRNKVRYIVAPESLYSVQEVINLRPKPQAFKTYNNPLPHIPLEAPNVKYK